MPIEIQCQKCQKKLKVADKFAGKKAKCPNCQGILEIPGPAAAEPTATPAAKAPTSSSQVGAAAPKSASKSASTIRSVPKHKDEWYLQTEDGEQYGPVTKTEMDSWLEEGRVDATCQLLCDGWEQWKWAEEVYPKLAATPAAPAVEEPVTPAVQLNTGPVKTPTAAVNPFVAPREPAATTYEPETGGGGLSEKGRHALADTRPWVLFLSILGFVGCGLLGLVSAIYLIVALVAIAHAGLVGLIVLFMTLIMVAAAVLYGFASYYLFSYASNIQKYLRSRRQADLDQALISQKSFWKLVGIVTAVFVTLQVIILALQFIVIGMGAMSAASRFK